MISLNVLHNHSIFFELAKQVSMKIETFPFGLVDRASWFDWLRLSSNRSKDHVR